DLAASPRGRFLRRRRHRGSVLSQGQLHLVDGRLRRTSARLHPGLPLDLRDARGRPGPPPVRAEGGAQLPVHPLLPDRQPGFVDDAGGARDAQPRGCEHAEIGRRGRRRPRPDQLRRPPTACDRPDRQEGPLMTQIIEISTQYQLANISALIRSGRLGEGGRLGEAGHLGDDGPRRILVVANNSFAPELSPAADTMPGSRGLLADFDLVIDWKAVISPNHPRAFGISGERAPIMERALRRQWGIDDHEPLELIVESLPGHPAGALTQIFSTAAICVHSDGLMSYGPIRNPLTLPQWQRLRTIFYTDLLPGITPRQLAEHTPDRVVLPTADLADVIDAMTAEVADDLASAGLDSPIGDSALVLGQYLAQLDL